MENKGKLLFFVFILLVILGIFGYFYMIKSQIEKDFTLESGLPEDVINISVEKLPFEVKAIYEVNMTAGVGYRVGEVVVEVFPYYYNNTSYAVAIIVPNKGWLPIGDPYWGRYGGMIDRFEVRVYDLCTGEVVSNATVYAHPTGYYMYDLETPIWGKYGSYYIDDSGRLIAGLWTSYDTDNPYVCCPYVEVYKITVDGANISGIHVVRYYEYSTITRCRAPAFVFESRDVDYVGSYAPPNTYEIRAAGTIINSINYYITDGNVYETKNMIVVLVEADYGDYSAIYAVFDKQNKTLITTGKIVNKTYGAIVGYNEDIVIIRSNPLIVIKSGRLYNTTNFTDTNIMWIKGDKILSVTTRVTSNGYYAYYKMYRYNVTDTDFNIWKVSEGLFMNLTPFYRTIWWEWDPGQRWNGVEWYNKRIEVSGLEDRYLLILFGTYEYKIGSTIYLGIVDLDNYKVYTVKIAEKEYPQIEVPHGRDWYYGIFRRGVHNLRSLLPIEWEFNWYVYDYNTGRATYINMTEELTLYTIKAEMRIINVTNETIVTNETNITPQPQPQPQPQPRPQPGFGIEITPTPTEINITYPNVTQNVTTTRPTGIQSVIEIIRKNPWIILAAILLLVLIAAGLRRRTS